jgi:uncharacterized protein (DUF488 family)
MGVIMSRAETPEQMFSAERLFSIGHSNLSMLEFLDLLRAASVTAVADVRSRPYSGRYPQFNRPELEQSLREADIHYGFLGDLLGGRPDRMSLYDVNGRVDYERVRATGEFQRGLDKLIKASEEHRVAMLCAEEDPLDCHRGLMIAPALAAWGIHPLHIRRDGTNETTEQMEQRLLEETGVGVGILDGLFAASLSDADRRELLADAYRLMARRKAFRMLSDVTDTSAE